ncbi:DUF559 domain-containing protein [Azospirillum sp. INR13]|uniref:DUF559 domain-containing protein n=1 Tax=Azospirillum sp. INR13 TaxID=2596919 RepID=UPI0021077EAB|nr:DUF559 domain-containing protein [Azospirillum sp. INR13]
MRSLPTDAERRLWQYLRNGQLGGWRFRRQHPIPPTSLISPAWRSASRSRSMAGSMPIPAMTRRARSS